jgi:hypothetical protein
MKTCTKSLLVSLLLIIAAPVYSVPTRTAQIFTCTYNKDETSSEQVQELATAWLKAAKEMKGGANMKVVIRFPIATGSAGKGDFRFVITTPTFSEWGAFTDAYEGSAAAKVDEEFDNIADCGNSTMWEAMIIH